MSNFQCEYFPCHKDVDPEQFNCLFCYCPLYVLGPRCGGAFTYTENGKKDCSSCLLPHEPTNYDYIISRYDDIIELVKYANEKGVQVFGLYSTNNPEDQTLLYALIEKKKAGKTYQRLKEWETLNRGRHQSNEVLGASIRSSESIEGGRSDTAIDFPADDRGMATTGDVRVPGEHTGSNQPTDSAEV